MVAVRMVTISSVEDQRISPTVWSVQFVSILKSGKKRVTC